MPQPASFRLWGLCLGYLGMALALFWIASVVWRQEGAGGSVIDMLERVPPTLWLLIPIAGIPGFLLHLAGDRIQARHEHISVREVQFRRHLNLTQPRSRPESEK